MAFPRFHAFVSRGKNKGVVLYPHVHEDGKYVVSKTRFEDDYERVDSEAEILNYLENGYSLRMSNPEAGVSATSLITPESVFRPVVLT